MLPGGLVVTARIQPINCISSSDARHVALQLLLQLRLAMHCVDAVPSPTDVLQLLTNHTSVAQLMCCQITRHTRGVCPLSPAYFIFTADALHPRVPSHSVHSSMSACARRSGHGAPTAWYHASAVPLRPVQLLDPRRALRTPRLCECSLARLKIRTTSPS